MGSGSAAYYDRKEGSPYKKGNGWAFLRARPVADCASPLAFSRKELKNGEKGIYRCSRYNNNGGAVCSTHYVEEDFIAMAVLNDIRQYAVLTGEEQHALTDDLLGRMNATRTAEAKTFDKEIARCESRLKIISDSIRSLYEDKVSGTVPVEIFQSLLADFMREQMELNHTLASAKQRKEYISAAESEVNNWLRLIQQLTTIEKLNRKIVCELIDCVIVSQARKEGGKRKQEITIQYRFISGLLEMKEKDIA